MQMYSIMSSTEDVRGINKKTIDASATTVLRDRARIRTWDRLLRRQMLYPAELRDQFNLK